MKIILSGGAKTINIKNGIEKKFKSSGDEVSVENYIEDIASTFSRGDTFDKALITEQSISRDGAIASEAELRQRVNDFAASSAHRNRKNESYVFLVQSEAMAELISDETFMIKGSSVVVLKTPPYSVNFFVTLLVNDITKIPDEFVYHPAAITGEVLESNAAEAVGENEDEEDAFQTSTEEFESTKMNGFGQADSLEDLGLFDDSDLPLPSDGNELFNEGLGSAIPGFDDTDNEDNSFDGVQGFVGNEQSGQFGNASINENNAGIKETNTSMGGNETSNQFNRAGIKETDAGINVSGASRENSDLGFDDFDDFESNDENTQADNFNTQADNFNTQADNFNTQAESAKAVIPGFDESDYDDTDNKTSEQSFENNDTFGEIFNEQYAPVGSVGEMQVGKSASIEDNLPDTQEEMFNAFETEAQQEQQNNMQVPQNNEQVQNNTQAVAGFDTKQLKGKQARFNRNKANQQREQAPKREAPQSTTKGLSVGKIKDALGPFAARGNSIVVTGCGGCGTSFIAHNLANIICQLGFTVLLVDMDTKGRTQSYISKCAYDNMEADGANLMAAVNSSTGINNHYTVIKQGFHLLTMGLGADTATAEELLHKEKINRFANLAKSTHNFVIYDVPFNDATNFLSDLTYTADNLVLTMDASNWGVVKTMLSVCNISSEDMQDVMFKRAQIVINRLRNLNKVMGCKIRTGTDILKVMDKMVLDLVGDDPGFYFSNFKISGIINDDPNVEDCWFEDTQYSDTKKGQAVFLELLYNIIMNK